MTARDIRTLAGFVGLLAFLPVHAAVGQGIYQVQGDPRIQVRLQGRLMIDAAAYAEDIKGLSSGTELRRARVGALGAIDEDWVFEIEVDVADAEVDVKDAWLAYTGVNRWTFKVGNFKEPFGLENLISSRHITFLERGLPDALAVGRHIGLGFTGAFDRVVVQGGYFGQEVEDVGDDEIQRNEGFGLTGRVAAFPIHTPTEIVHLGISATRRTPDARDDGERRARFRTRSETHVDRTRFLNTGNIADVDYTTAFGLEAAAVYGAFSVQGEYLRTNVTRIGAPSASFDGAYVYGSWFVTGESRAYVPGIAEFGPLTPRAPHGAVELAVRYSTIDLNDAAAGVLGGSGRNWTIAGNWYVDPRVRIMTNVVIVDHDQFADADGDYTGNDDFRIWQVRFQYDF